MLEIFLLGVLTGLVVTLVAIYSYSKIVATGHIRRDDTDGESLTAAIIKEQSKLLSGALRRRRYNLSIIIIIADAIIDEVKFFTAIDHRLLAPVLAIAIEGGPQEHEPDM